MSARRSMLAWDARLQARYGVYAVYAVLTLAFVVGLRALPPGLRTDAAVLVIVTDPTVLGFYFIAAMVLFEKEAGVLSALVTSPLGDAGYLASKTVTLSALAVVTAALVAVLGHGPTPGFWFLVAGVGLGGSLFVLVGFVAVARFDSVNAYFISAVGWGTVLFLPLFGYLGLVETPLFYLLPTQAVLVLVEGGFRPLAAWQAAYGLGYLLVGNAVAYAWARRAFRRHVVRGGDPGRHLGRREVSAPDRPAVAGPHSPWVGMVAADLRNWVRDPLLVLAAAGPLVLAVVLRFGAPAVAGLAANVVQLEPHYPVVTGAMAVFGPALYGFVVGMFVLEDRELGVLAAYRVSPLSWRGYLLYRGLVAYALGLLATVPALAVVELVPVPPAVILSSAAVGALGGPLFALAFGSLADNTIEGIALSKLLNLVVLGPALVIAVAPPPLDLVAGVVPTYWPVKALVAGVAGDPRWPAYLVGGVAVHLVGLALLRRAFGRRAD